MRGKQQFRSFTDIKKKYAHDMPLSRFLPAYFRQNRQMGSKDRKAATRLIYNYYRIGNLLKQLSDEERLAIAEFLCNTSPTEFLEDYNPKQALKAGFSIDEKIDELAGAYPDFNLNDVFPLHDLISQEIEKNSFLRSFFTQPDLFIRVKPDDRPGVLQNLKNKAVFYIEEPSGAIRLANGTNLKDILDHKIYQVQDLSSQRTVDYFKPEKYEAWWDCCAASGGKSLALLAAEPSIKLVVSDVRESVLENLDERFQEAGIKKYQKKILDLTQSPASQLHNFSFDGIILDAPCSGSGTWGRTPEMIYQFKRGRLPYFTELQQKISSNVVPYLKEGKPLIYITCSVFKAENEDIVNYLQEKHQLKLEEMNYLKGYQAKADTMFVARLIKGS